MKKRLLFFVLPFVGYIFVRFLNLTCKKKFFFPSSLPQTPVIIAFWHGELLMQPFLYNQIRPNHKVTAIISEHSDGEIISRLIGYFGFESSRGSARKNDAKALLSSIRKMDDGYDVAITPDGPKGPRHSIAEGIVAIAKKKNAQIVPCNFQASSFWQFRSWDKFTIPKPFSTISFYAGEPIDISDIETEDAIALIKTELLKNAII